MSRPVDWKSLKQIYRPKTPKKFWTCEERAFPTSNFSASGTFHTNVFRDVLELNGWEWSDYTDPEVLFKVFFFDGPKGVLNVRYQRLTLPDFWNYHDPKTQIVNRFPDGSFNNKIVLNDVLTAYSKEVSGCPVSNIYPPSYALNRKNECVAFIDHLRKEVCFDLSLTLPSIPFLPSP